MDPNATWRMLCATLGDLGKHPDDQELREQALELREQALAHWFKTGGFPPISVLDEACWTRWFERCSAVSFLLQ